VASKEAKADGLCSLKITHRTVGNQTVAAPGLENMSVDFPGARSKPRMLIEVFQYDDARGWNSEKVIPPICSIRVSASAHRGFRRPDATGNGIPEHWRQIREHATDTGVHEALVAQAHVKKLNRIRDLATAQFAERLQFFWGQ